MDQRFGLQLQALTSRADQVLVVCDLLRQRVADGRFSAAEVTATFRELNVPPPKNVGTMFSVLRSREHLLRQPDGRWALTPTGVQTVDELGVKAATLIERDGAKFDGAEFAHVDHSIIPSWAAPPRWQAGIRRLQERSPFESNVLCMTRFPSEGSTPDPVHGAINLARQTLSDFGLNLCLASDAIVDEDLLGNVGAYMWACRYGMAILEDRLGLGLNYNAVIEVGAMIMTGRRCTILKDRTVPRLPTDLAGQIYRSVDLDDVESVEAAVNEWASGDLALQRQ